MSSSVNGNSAGNCEVAIQLDHVTRTFGKTHAVDDVSFHVRAGEVFGFIGPNGAGKTTSMRILSTLEVPTAGEAWVDGFSVIDDPDRVRQRLGWMPDGFGTYPNVNCEEYLDFFARSYGLRGNERRAALRRVMGFTQLDQLAEKPVDGLSKGMKQRLCLGRALIHDPTVLILDEPAAGLDPRARIELREMIGELASEGKSLLISSHILTELAEMCDRVGIIEQGRMLAVGSVEEILYAHQHAGEGEAGAHSEAMQVWATVLSDVAAATAWLSQQAGVNQVQLAQGMIKFQCSPQLEFQAELLARMIGEGIRVASFAGKQKSLEEVFLKVTRGRVQ
jgi:ABC-2 type transport system ATP-binding protein